MVSVEVRRGYSKRWRRKNPHKMFQSYKNWQDNNRHKVRAKIIAERYTQLKSHCEKCGSNEKLERHHTDYGKPLEVLTLCKNCHEAMPEAIYTQPKGPENRFLNGKIEVEIIDDSYIPMTEKNRLWTVKVVDSGEILKVRPNNLHFFPKNTLEKS